MRGIYVLVTAVAAAGLACGDSGSNTGGGSNVGGEGVGGGSPSGGGPSGGGTPSGCEGVLGSLDSCSVCVETNCCPDLDACVGDENCNGCLTGDGDYCPDSLFESLDACVNANCMSECTASNECNPVNNEGCFSDEACDLADAFTCFPAPHDVPLCEDCGAANGPWCSPGSTCVPEVNLCGRYCCADTDCGTGVCNFDVYHDPNVGVCTVQLGIAPVCDAPAVSPSGGTCGDF